MRIGRERAAGRVRLQPVGSGSRLGTQAPSTISLRRPLLLAGLLLVGSMTLGVAVGPVEISLHNLGVALLERLPWLSASTDVPALDEAIVWQLRLPRVVLACMVGAMLAAGGAAYQGVFRNPLADPYLLGVAAGAGLGATAVIVSGPHHEVVLPLVAFLGAVGAVVMTYVVAAAGRGGTAGQTIVLAGVAVAALLTAVQTYLQQQHVQEIQQVYNWLLGSLAVATWADVVQISPYVAVSAVVLLAHGRILDVLRVGEDEAAALGVHPARARLIIVVAATLGTAAAVSVSGLIGFVGIIVPHAVRLTSDASYRVLLPVSMIGGGAFLVLADVVARTVQAPAELPIGVVTALIGAPFFLLALRSRRTRQGVL